MVPVDFVHLSPSSSVRVSFVCCIHQLNGSCRVRQTLHASEYLHTVSSTKARVIFKTIGGAVCEVKCVDDCNMRLIFSHWVFYDMLLEFLFGTRVFT